MESSKMGSYVGMESGANIAFAGVAATNAPLSPGRLNANPFGDMQSAAIAQLADSLAVAAASLAADPASTSSGIVEITSPLASAGPSFQTTDLLRPLQSREQLPPVDQHTRRMLSELLPPARLVEVAHAALQSSGFRRRQPGVTTSETQQAPMEQAAELQAMVGPDDSTALKREHSLENGTEDSNGDIKRPRSDSSGEQGPQAPVATPFTIATDAIPDSIARITLPGPALALPQLPLPPTESGSSIKRELPTASHPSLPAVSTSNPPPLARPPSARASVDVAIGLAPPVDSAVPPAPSLNGALKSAFQAASLCADWQPGCSVTTGRRSARTAAHRSARNLSLSRAASMDANSSPFSRRDSGMAGTTTGAVPLPETQSGSGANVLTNGGMSASDAHAGTGPQAGGTGSGNEPQAATETAASADLRRLAQLAEAAAMLEAQLGTDGGEGTQRGGLCAESGEAAVHEHGVMGGEEGSGRMTSGGSLRQHGAEHSLTLRHRAGSLTAAGLGLESPTGSGVTGSAGCGGGGGMQPHGIPTPTGSLRPGGSLSLHGRLPDCQQSGGWGRGGGGGREGSPGDGMEDAMMGSPRRCHGDTEAISGAASQDHELRGEGEDDEGQEMGEDGGDGSNDSAGGGSSAGGGGGRTLTERYRAALKASAAQRGRQTGGNGLSRQEADKQLRGAPRNGVCARIASITKERLQQVYHLNIEEAARELGIGMTKLKEHCRTLGIPRWPSRKLKSMDKLIESLNERAMTEPATKEVIADILAEIEQFKRAIYENPCLEVEEDIKRLRQSNFKKEYQQRQVEQRLRQTGSERERGLTGRASSSAGGGAGSQHLQHSGGSLREVTSNAISLTAAAAAAGGSAGTLTSCGLPSSLISVSLTTAGLGPLPGDQGAASHQLVQTLSGLSGSQQLQGQMPLLSPGLQQLLLAQSPSALQQLMTQRALGGLPAGSLLLPSMLPQALTQPLTAAVVQAAVGPMAGGEEAMAAEAAVGAAVVKHEEL